MRNVPIYKGFKNTTFAKALFYWGFRMSLKFAYQLFVRIFVLLFD